MRWDGRVVVLATGIFCLLLIVLFVCLNSIYSNESVDDNNNEAVTGAFNDVRCEKTHL
jgi:hypothetical protein